MAVYRRGVADEPVVRIRDVEAGGGHVSRQDEAIARVDPIEELVAGRAGGRGEDVYMRRQVVLEPIVLLHAVLRCSTQERERSGPQPSLSLSVGVGVGVGACTSR